MRRAECSAGSRAWAVLSAHLGPRITRLRTCHFHDSGGRGDCCTPAQAELGRGTL